MFINAWAAQRLTLASSSRRASRNAIIDAREPISAKASAACFRTATLSSFNVPSRRGTARLALQPRQPSEPMASSRTLWSGDWSASLKDFMVRRRLLNVAAMACSFIPMCLMFLSSGTVDRVHDETHGRKRSPASLGHKEGQLDHFRLLPSRGKQKRECRQGCISQPRSCADWLPYNVKQTAHPEYQVPHSLGEAAVKNAAKKARKWLGAWYVSEKWGLMASACRREDHDDSRRNHSERQPPIMVGHGFLRCRHP